MAHGYSFTNAGSGKAASHPVQTVSWWDVVKWCNARSEMQGRTPCYYTDDGQTVVYRSGQVNVTNAQVKWNANGYRLPTEAEWEKAARGGLSGQRFPWGATINQSLANYYAYPAGYPCDTNATQGFHPSYASGAYPYTSPVLAFPANGYGLRDMAGNVWQWCWDWYGASYYGASPSTDPQGPPPPPGSYRVFRGGSWYGFAGNCRTADRNRITPVNAIDYIGFRPVRR